MEPILIRAEIFGVKVNKILLLVLLYDGIPESNSMSLFVSLNLIISCKSRTFDASSPLR